MHTNSDHIYVNTLVQKLSIVLLKKKRKESAGSWQLRDGCNHTKKFGGLKKYISEYFILQWQQKHLPHTSQWSC